MTKNDIMEACKQSQAREDLLAIIHIAVNKLTSWESPRIASSAEPLPVEHTRSIYQQRLMRCDDRGLTPQGMRQSVDVFNSFPNGTPLWSVIIQNNNEFIYFWLDKNVTAVACVIGK